MFNRLTYFFRNYFGFTRAETRGSLLLIILLLISSAIPILIRHGLAPGMDKAELHVINEPWLDSLSLALATRPQTEDGYTKNLQVSEDKSPEKASLSPFNPNTATPEELMTLGLPKWLAERIDKYRLKGGRFRQKTDLLKIYGLSTETYTRLEPFIELPVQATYTADTRAGKPDHNQAYALTPEDSARQAERKAYAAVTFPFDINTADSIQLKALKGVGSKTAAKIMARRADLGGFIHPAQFEEIWGVSDEALDELEQKTFIADGYKPAGILVNSATPEEMWRHPYLVRHQARAIEKYRLQHGPFKQPEDLLRIKVIDAEAVQKLSPYLDFSLSETIESAVDSVNTSAGE